MGNSISNREIFFLIINFSLIEGCWRFSTKEKNKNGQKSIAFFFYIPFQSLGSAGSLSSSQIGILTHFGMGNLCSGYCIPLEV